MDLQKFYNRSKNHENLMKSWANIRVGAVIGVHRKLSKGYLLITKIATQNTCKLEIRGTEREGEGKRKGSKSGW